MSKLFCTFVEKGNIDGFVEEIQRKYTLIYNKVFVLDFENKDEYIITYNTEQGNLWGIPKDTILVHRKKEYNVLYSINALNNLIKSLNNGNLDKNYKITWENYKNSVLLSANNEKGFNKLNTTLHKIIKL